MAEATSNKEIESVWDQEKKISKRDQVPTAAALLREARAALVSCPEFLNAAGPNFDAEKWNLPEKLVTFVKGKWKYTVVDNTDLTIGKQNIVISRKEYSDYDERTFREMVDIMLGFRAAEDQELNGAWTYNKLDIQEDKSVMRTAFETARARDNIRTFLSEIRSNSTSTH